jgi:hypothetical protein
MSYYPGLGSVNWGNAISQGLKNGADAYNQYSDDQRKRKQEEEDRALKKQQADLQIGNLTIQQKQLQQQQQDYEANTGLRKTQREVELQKLTEYKNGAGTREAQDKFNKQKIEFETNRLAIEKDEFDDEQRKKLDDMSEDFNMVATGQAPPELLMKKYKMKVEGLKQVDTGVVEGIINGERGYRIDHPNLKGRQDLAFSMLVGEKSLGLSDEQKKESSILISRALRGNPEAGAMLASKYPQLNDVLQYQERFNPNAKLTAEISKLTDYRNEFALSLKGAPDMTGELARVDGEIKAKEGFIISNNKPIGGGAGGTSTKTDPNKSKTTGIGNLPQKDAANPTMGNNAKPSNVNPYTEKWINSDIDKALSESFTLLNGKESTPNSKDREVALKEIKKILPQNPTKEDIKKAVETVSKNIRGEEKKAPSYHQQRAFGNYMPNF